MFLFHLVFRYLAVKQKQNVFVPLSFQRFGSETKTKCFCFVALVFWPCWHSIMPTLGQQSFLKAEAQLTVSQILDSTAFSMFVVSKNHISCIFVGHSIAWLWKCLLPYNVHIPQLKFYTVAFIWNNNGHSLFKLFDNFDGMRSHKIRK